MESGYGWLELGGFGAALPSCQTLFLGGGGGAAQRHRATDGSGGAGGGIVIIRICDRGRDSANEGSGGGGAGSSVRVIVYDETPLTGLTVAAIGGDGGDAWPTNTTTNANAAHGPGAAAVAPSLRTS